MTERTWLTCSNPWDLRDFVRGRTDGERFRWLAVEWGRRIRDLFAADDLPWFDAFEAWVTAGGPHPAEVCSRPKLDWATRFPSRAEFAARAIVISNVPLIAMSAGHAAAEQLPLPRGEKWDAVEVDAAEARRETSDEHKARVGREFCDHFRDVAGNPFRPFWFDPAWRTEAVVGIAALADESGEFGNLPVLADALQDAGCEDAEILTHLRGPGPHVRGCWAVDAVLGRFGTSAPP